MPGFAVSDHEPIVAYAVNTRRPVVASRHIHGLSRRG